MNANARRKTTRADVDALERDRVDDRTRHTRARARAIDDERSRTDRRVESERARDLAKRGRANGTMAMRASVSARAAIATTTVRARRDARWTREKNARGRGKRARGFGWDRRARSGARDAGEEGRGGSGSRRARAYLQPRAEAREPGRARDARGMMARDDGEERWRGRRTRERWARRATRRREAGRLTTRGFSKRAGDERENDARGARDAGGSGDARRRHWTARTAEEEG